MDSLQVISLGQEGFEQTLERQTQLREQRQAGLISDTILTVEHPRVITQGRRPAEEDFKIPPKELRARGFEIQKVGRGGKLTYHGPGQFVAYFIVSLNERKVSVPQFVRLVETTVLETLSEFKIQAKTRKDCPGVWFEDQKIASVGLSIHHGVSMHGIALNVNPNLQDFQVIIPCGIPDCSITSMAQVLGYDISLQEVKKPFQKSVKKVFD